MKRVILPLLCMMLLAQTMFAQKEISKKFTGVKSIRMTTASGDCKLVKSGDASVAVSLRHTYEGNYEPSMEQNGDRLEIKERFNGNNVSGSATWTLTVPEGVRIRFTTGSGNIEASNMKLDLDANTGSGDLVFIKTTGEIKGNTGSGDIELEGFDGTVDVNTGSGSARIQNCSGDIKANCGSGTIRLADSKGEFSANTGSGDVTGKNITLAGSSRFNSGSGDANVVLGSSPKFDISVNSGSGDAELNFNGNEIAGEITMEASKRNGRINAPFEFDHTEEFSNGGSSVIVRKTVVKKVTTPRVHVGTGSGNATIKQ